MPPAISVAMSTFNGARFLREQLDSLAAQSLPPVELHIGDDGSTDDTAAIVAAFARTAPFPVHFHLNSVQLGFGENFIKTSGRCRGDWIAFCDQDDRWLPHKLARCAEAIGRGGADLRLVAHDAWVTDEALTPVRALYGYPPFTLHPRLHLSPEWFCVGFSQLVSRRLFDDVPTTPRPSFSWHPHRDAHDVWAAAVANATGAVIQLGEPLVLYRRHDAAVTDTGRVKTDFRALVRTKLGGDPESFALRAGYAADLAEIFADYASRVADRELSRRLDDASVRVRAYGRVLERRAGLYRGRSVAGRAAAFWRLVADGAYAPGRPWMFGRKNMAKDGLNIVLPAVMPPPRD